MGDLGGAAGWEYCRPERTYGGRWAAPAGRLAGRSEETRRGRARAIRAGRCRAGRGDADGNSGKATRRTMRENFVRVAHDGPADAISCVRALRISDVPVEPTTASAGGTPPTNFVLEEAAEAARGERVGGAMPQCCGLRRREPRSDGADGGLHGIARARRGRSWLRMTNPNDSWADMNCEM